MQAMDDTGPSCSIGSERAGAATWPTIDSDTMQRRRAAAARFAGLAAGLRDLDPDAPRIYAVADLALQSKRRWWPLIDGATSGRFEALCDRVRTDHDRSDVVIDLVATALVHAVVGRVASAYVGFGYAWDPGVENLWLHLDSDVGIDWAGVADPRLRAVAGASGTRTDGVVDMPCEDALVVWIAHRCVTSLRLVEEALSEFGPVDGRRFRRTVGDSVLGTASRVPALAGLDSDIGWRRGQYLIDAFGNVGYPIRGRQDPRDLGQPVLYSRPRSRRRIVQMS